MKPEEIRWWDGLTEDQRDAHMRHGVDPLDGLSQERNALVRAAHEWAKLEPQGRYDLIKAMWSRNAEDLIPYVAGDPQGNFELWIMRNLGPWLFEREDIHL